jgi:cell division protein FtsZ
MTINLSLPRTEMELRPRIIVVGVGGAGGNAISNMIRANLEGVEFVATNTDAQALAQSQAERKIQLGRNITQGLGAGSRPDIGRAAAEEALDEIMEHLEACNMVFITAGMGGGTGTGAGPVIARAAREQGILTVGVVTKPFHFEGSYRMRMAEQGIDELQQFVDTLIIIPNQNLFRLANEKTTFAEAFKMADNVLYSGVRGVTDLMVMPGLINLDFADIRSVMSEMGKAMMGTGEGEGERRAIDAAEAAISNPLLEDITMKGAKGVLINITGSLDMTLFEVDEAANRIRDEVDPDANIIFGSTFDEQLQDVMRVSVVATGIEADAERAPRPVPLSLVSDTTKPQPIVAPAKPIGAAAPAVALANEPKPVTAPDPDSDEAAEVPAAKAAAGSEPPPSREVANETEAGMDSAEWLIARLNADTGPRPVDRPAADTPTAAEAPFIAPKPAEPIARRVTMPPAKVADPFAAAALENGGQEPGRLKGRGPSLFERVTGGGRGRLAIGGKAPADKPGAEQPAPDTAPAPNRAVQAKPAPGKPPRLGGISPDDRLTPSSDGDDLLDIPAFLRRQAN